MASWFDRDTKTITKTRDANGNYSITFNVTARANVGYLHLIVNTSETSMSRGEQIGGDGVGSRKKIYTGTSFGAVSKSATWYLWRQPATGYDPVNDDSISFSATIEAAEFTVTFDPGQGTTPTASKPVTYGEPYGDPPVPVRSGYAFLGWFTDPDDGTEIEATDTVSITADTTLYAHWEAMSILHVAEGGETKTVTNIQAVEGGTVRKVIGCYSVQDGVVRQGV